METTNEERLDSAAASAGPMELNYRAFNVSVFLIDQGQFDGSPKQLICMNGH